MNKPMTFPSDHGYFVPAQDRASDETRSRAWQPLFALRAQPGTVSLQYALAGMNAHINFDLGLALVRTCRQLGRTQHTKIAR